MKIVIDKEQFGRTLKRMTHEIIEKNEDLKNIVLAGIERKGTPIAEAIRDLIFKFEGIEVPLEKIDITPHRDDHKRNNVEANIDFKYDIKDKIVILVDDVLYTGRSVRAAMEAVMDAGRPAKIELVVFVDRGHRELPIRADVIGKNIPTSREEKVVFDMANQEVILKQDGE